MEAKCVHKSGKQIPGSHMEGEVIVGLHDITLEATLLLGCVVFRPRRWTLVCLHEW